MTREELIDRLRRDLGTRGDDLAAAYLFGSWARGEQGPESDVDVAMLPQAADLDAPRPAQSATKAAA